MALLEQYLRGRGAPRNFESGGRLRTFVKIRHTRHEIMLHPDGRAEIISEVCFTNSDRGTPIIDFHLQPSINASVTLDGASLDLGTEVVPAPDNSPYEYRVVKGVVDADSMHCAQIRYDAHLTYAADLPLFFEMNDFEDTSGTFKGRCFLDRYLPANLEFDQHPMEIAINWDPSGAVGLSDHTVFSNGSVISYGGNRVEISFPSHFNSSSPFLVVAKRDAVHSVRFEHPRQLRDQRPVQVTTFTTAALGGPYEDHSAQAFTALRELERFLGPFPYDQLLLLSSKTMAMEYAGAAAVSESRVRHEISHSYFGRGTLAANGDAGWIDEAVAVWIDRGRRRLEGAPTTSSDCGNRGPHYRRTYSDVSALTWPLMAHLAYLIDRMPPQESSAGSRFEEVIRKISRIGSALPLLATDFEDLLTSLTQRSYRSLFLQCIYGGHRP